MDKKGQQKGMAILLSVFILSMVTGCLLTADVIAYNLSDEKKRGLSYGEYERGKKEERSQFENQKRYWEFQNAIDNREKANR